MLIRIEEGHVRLDAGVLSRNGELAVGNGSSPSGNGNGRPGGAVRSRNGAARGARGSRAVWEVADPVTVRPARIGDMAQVAPVIADFARRGIMLPKSLDQLYRTFREFLLAVDADGQVVGCAALRVYDPDTAEVTALAVAESAHGRGIGRRLLSGLMAEAASLGLRTLFALTLEPTFFHRLGFETVSRERFPLKIAADCRGCPRAAGCMEITVATDLDIERNEENRVDA